MRICVLVAAGMLLLAARLAGITLPSWNVDKGPGGDVRGPLDFQSLSIPAEARHIFYQPVPINDVGRDVLVSLPEIGPRLADRIIALRLRRGGIRSAEELLEVPGISRRKLNRLLPEITFDKTGH